MTKINKSQLVTIEMDTNQINKRLRSIPNFVGTFPADRIPVVCKKPASFIINFDRHTSQGSHWVALLLLSNGEAEYMDSFGFAPIQKDILNYIKQNSKAYTYNCQQFQHPFAISCGLYAIHFIKHRARGLSFESFSAHFSKNLTSNKIMINELE